jgi:hypothetical protein
MTDYHEPQVTICDQPFLVLKYVRRHVVSSIVWFAVGILLFSGIGVGLIELEEIGTAKQNILLMILGLLVGILPCMMIYYIVDLLSFKEIRLYQNRIVRVGRHGGEKAIPLIHAMLRLILPYYHTVVMCHQDARLVLRDFKAIRYYGDLADPKDAIRLKYVLAALSGRQVQELEAPGRMNRWIKLADTLRVVSQNTMDYIEHQVLHEHLEERKYNRSAIIASIVMMICFGLPLLVLCSFVIWWLLK